MELERKLIEEYRLKEEAQNKLVEYENEEMEALKRIRTTTQVHKNSKFILRKKFFNSLIDQLSLKLKLFI